MGRTLRAFVLVGAVVITGACSDEQPARVPVVDTSTPAVSAAPSEGPTSSGRPGSRCPNEVDAVGAGTQVGGGVAGDVDADGSDDLSYLVQDESGGPGCQTFLVVEASSGTVSIPTGEPGVDYALQAPRINSLAQVDGSGGMEILVDLEQGAATQFLGMFTLVDGVLEKVRIRGGSPYGDLFPYGGSVGHIEASNCARGANVDVLIAMATPNATDYTIRTVLYEMRAATLIPLPRSEQPPMATGADVELSEGFDSSPFGDCPTSP